MRTAYNRWTQFPRFTEGVQEIRNSVDGTDHAGVVTFHRLGDTTTRVTLQLDTVPEGVVETLGDKLGPAPRAT